MGSSGMRRRKQSPRAGEKCRFSPASSVPPNVMWPNNLEASPLSPLARPKHDKHFSTDSFAELDDGSVVGLTQATNDDHPAAVVDPAIWGALTSGRSTPHGVGKSRRVGHSPRQSAMDDGSALTDDWVLAQRRGFVRHPIASRIDRHSPSADEPASAPRGSGGR
jgi:hypothetical protein